MADSIKIVFELEQINQGKAFKKTEDQASVSGKKAGNNFAKNFSKQTSTTLSSLRNRFLGVAVAAIGVSKAINAIGDSLRNLRGFSRGVAEINSILPKNQKLTEQATQSLINFSTTFGTNQQKQARAFYNIVSAGVKGTEKQLKTLAVANRAAVAGLVDIDTAARAIVSSVNAYSKSGLTAQQASDALFVAVREGQTTFGELADFLGNATSIAANAGVTFEELAGSLAFVTKSGISTDVATTGLRQVFAAVISPTKEAADEALRLGIQFNAAAIRAKGLAGFLADVQKQSGGSEESLSKLFGNIRALAPILNIVNGNTKDFNRILNETKNASGATSDAFGEIRKNIDFKLDQATAQWKAFGLNLLRVVSPAIRETAETLTFLGSVFNSVFKEESAKPLDVINKKLTRTARDLNFLGRELEAARNKKDIFFRPIPEDKNDEFQRLKKRIDGIKELRRNLLKDRAQILSNRKQLAEQETQVDNKANEKQVNNAVNTAQKLRDLGVLTTESIKAEQERKLAILTTLRQQELVSDQTFNEAKLQIQQQANQQFLALEQQRLQNASINLNNLKDAFKLNSKTIGLTVVDLAKTMQTSFARGVGNAFQNVGKALKEGTNAFDAFTKGLGQMLADMASQLGDFYIAKGIAYLADPITATSGKKMIAAGAGLKILSGLLGAQGGGAAQAAGGGAGSVDNGALDQTGLQEPQDIERQEPQTNVEVVVQGSLVQQEELGTFIAETLSDSFGKQGVSLTDARIA